MVVLVVVFVCLYACPSSLPFIIMSIASAFMRALAFPPPELVITRRATGVSVSLSLARAPEISTRCSRVSPVRLPHHAKNTLQTTSLYHCRRIYEH